jgi:hypothetical protein
MFGFAVVTPPSNRTPHQENVLQQTIQFGGGFPPPRTSNWFQGGLLLPNRTSNWFGGGVTPPKLNYPRQFGLGGVTPPPNRTLHVGGVVSPTIGLVTGLGEGLLLPNRTSNWFGGRLLPQN